MSRGTPDERDLGRLFEADRARDRGATPPFERVLARGGRPPAGRGAGARGWIAAALLAAAVLGAVAVWRNRSAGPPGRPVFEIEAGVLRTPTDFLLDLAGPDLSRSMPSFGVSDWYPLSPEQTGRGDSTKGSERS